MGIQASNMGNNTTTVRVRSVHSSRDPKRLSICRVLGYFPGRDPDVDSLGVSFDVCHHIFLELPLVDLAACMLVCKEWRSLIDTCDFWRKYVTRHFSSTTVAPPLQSVLYWWKMNKSASDTSLEAVTSGGDGGGGLIVSPPDAYVFRPFPEMWESGLVVPGGLRRHLSGPVGLFHSFVSATNTLRALQSLVDFYGFSNIVHLCLFRWAHAPGRRPTPSEVMSVFGAHDVLTRDVELKQSVLGGLGGGEEDVDVVPCVVPPPQGVDYQGQTNFIEIYTRCFQAGMRDWLLAFQCSRYLLEPAPAFMVTLLAPGWAGGLLYGV